MTHRAYNSLAVILLFLVVLLCPEVGPRANASLVTTSPSGQNSSLAQGLVAWWTFDGKDTNWKTGTTTDRSGNGNTGRLINLSTTTNVVGGRLGQALMFNGASKLVDVTSTSSLNSLPLSVSFWFKSNGVAQVVFPGIVTKYAPGSSNGWWTGIGQTADTIVYWYYKDASNNIPSAHTFSFSLNVWHHAVVVFDTTGGYVYIDGARDSPTKAWTGTPGADTSAQNMQIGVYAGSAATQYFNGSVDDVRIYNRVLSAQEVKELYSMGASKQDLTPSVSQNSLQSGLLGWWTFDGKDTNWQTGKTFDRSGNNLTGQMIGLSTTTSPAPGKLGQSLNFAANYVDLGTNSSLSIANTPWTFSSWILFNATTTVNNYVFYEGDILAGKNFYVRRVGNYLFGYRNSAGTFMDYAVSTPYMGKWTQLTWVADGANNLALYINGALASTTYMSTGTSVQFRTLGCGSTPVGPVCLAGNLDDVRVYTRALSPAEIRELYALGAATKVDVTPTTPQNSLQSGLLGWWTFDGKDTNWKTGTTTDKTGNGNTGRLIAMSTTTSVVPGKLGQALRFDTSAKNYVVTPATTALSFNNGTTDTPFSISAWVYNSGGVSIVSKTSLASNLFEYAASVDSTGLLSFVLYNKDTGGDHTFANSTNAYTADLNHWAHYVFTYDGSGSNAGLKIYRNGVSIAVTPGNLGNPYVSMTAANLPVQIGAFQATGSFKALSKGLIDDVRIYSRALSPTEVARLYGGGR